MQKTVASFLSKVVEAYHLKEIEPVTPAFGCGKSYLLDYNGAYGKCWFYQSTPYAAMVFLDFRFNNDFSFPPQDTECTYISYYSRLHGAHCEMDGTETILRKETVYTNMYPFHHTQTRFSHGNSLQGISIVFLPDHFEEQVLQYTGDRIHLSDLNPFCSNDHPALSGIPTILDQIRNCSIQGSSTLARVFFNSKISELLAIFIDALSASANSHMKIAAKKSVVKEDDKHQIEQLIQYLREHPGKDINLPELAVIARMSTRKLTESFKIVTGMTIQEYRNHLRMDIATKMLTDSHKSIASIADALGFSSTSSFTNFFKRQTGISPRQYRAS